MKIINIIFFLIIILFSACKNEKQNKYNFICKPVISEFLVEIECDSFKSEIKTRHEFFKDTITEKHILYYWQDGYKKSIWYEEGTLFIFKKSD